MKKKTKHCRRRYQQCRCRDPRNPTWIFIYINLYNYVELCERRARVFRFAHGTNTLVQRKTRHILTYISPTHATRSPWESRKTKRLSGLWAFHFNSWHFRNWFPNEKVFWSFSLWLKSTRNLIKINCIRYDKPPKKLITIRTLAPDRSNDLPYPNDIQVYGPL